ncbi:MAG: hypothetical protein M9894_00670 [Planctomycetes bacterium]|nr:hypothetical protein [Planctomycetota bacterium]
MKLLFMIEAESTKIALQILRSRTLDRACQVNGINTFMALTNARLCGCYQDAWQQSGSCGVGVNQRNCRFHNVVASPANRQELT